MRRDLRQQVQFHQAIELAGCKLVLEAQRAEEGFVKEFCARDPDADALGGGLGVEVCAEFDLGEGAVREEAGVVAVIAQVVEGFVRVFNGDFRAGGVREEDMNHGCVEVGAVGVGLVGREDEEL